MGLRGFSGHTGEGSDLHDCAFGGYEERGEGLTHQHDAEDVGFERRLDLVQLDVQGRDGVVASGVVDQDVEVAVCSRLDLILERVDTGGVGDFQGERFYALIFESGDRFRFTGGGEDAEAFGFEFLRERVADAARCAACDENAF